MSLCETHTMLNFHKIRKEQARTWRERENNGLDCRGVRQNGAIDEMRSGVGVPVARHVPGGCLRSTCSGTRWREHLPDNEAARGGRNHPGG